MSEAVASEMVSILAGIAVDIHVMKGCVIAITVILVLASIFGGTSK